MGFVLKPYNKVENVYEAKTTLEIYSHKGEK